MFSWTPPIVALLAGALVACQDEPTPAPEAKPTQAPADAAYLAPPSVIRTRLEGGVMTLDGRAPAGSRVRLATPQGEAQFAQVDRQGRWSLALPPAAAPRILGLSAIAAGRQVQSQGYLLVTPTGQAAVLRAGAGAMRLDPQPSASVGAFDFDREGGAVVSGSAPAGRTVTLRLDGRQAAEGRADSTGRYSISLLSPIEAGSHVVEIVGEDFSARRLIDVRPAAPLSAGPFRSAVTPSGVRADWMTPGGGVQSTLILG